MADPHKILRIVKTNSNMTATLNNNQIGIETDQGEHLVHKVAGNYHVNAIQAAALISGRVLFADVNGEIDQDSDFQYDTSGEFLQLGKDLREGQTAHGSPGKNPPDSFQPMFHVALRAVLEAKPHPREMEAEAHQERLPPRFSPRPRGFSR